MEFALSSATTSTTLFISRLHRHIHTKPRCLKSQLLYRRFKSLLISKSNALNSTSTFSPWNLSAVSEVVSKSPPIRFQSRCVAAFGHGGGGGGGSGFGGGDGGGGDGRSRRGDLTKVNAVDDASGVMRDVIILDVEGMTCGGCAASVKRILENLPQVSSASVNLTTETAVIWPISEAKDVPNWQKELGEALAKHLTTCGFKANLRGMARELLKEIFHLRVSMNFYEGAFLIIFDSSKNNFFNIFEKKMEEKRNRLKESGRELVMSWAMCAVCLLGHLSHLLGAKASWIHAFHSTGFHFSLCLFTLLGPGRQLILDGLKSLFRGAPNMNTLVGLGALSSFTVSSLAALLPRLGWKTFFEEPIMLIAFVLLGRNLEQRAKIKATSDMTGLLSLLPSKARLLVNGDGKEISSSVEVPCNSLCAGDHIVVLPGDRVPVDGMVTSGRSTIDESSFTGEPLPVTKLPGSEVAAGSINLNGTLTIKVRKAGGETAMGNIVRMVEEAQSREAPVQRLADKVAGHFTYGVMALSAATFMFWNLFGAKILPVALYQGSPVSLALQLSCSVLVIACPCALGLATPTAVLVGTSLGATKGLLLRGGDVLEKFSMVDAVVFDKTGTLTAGRPVVTKIVTPGSEKDAGLQRNLEDNWSEVEVLKLAASVESNTVHPVGKAIVDAAKAINCLYLKVADGTFMEEPGSGVTATVENKQVSIGTLDWVKRHGVEENPFEELQEFKNQSVVYVGVDTALVGLIYFEDQIREEAGQVVKSLSGQGIKVYMLSGDKRSTAEYVASVVGIPKERVISGVKPDEKKKFIGDLQKSGDIVTMVGDGINDAAALATAHIGVAMGGGVGAASEVSSIVLMGNKLSQLLDALELSRLTMKTVKQNLWWAFAYNIVGLPIAAGLLLPVNGTILTPSIAGALMGLSSIGVMTNSLLLRFKFFEKRKHIYESSPNIKIQIDSVPRLDEMGKSNDPFSATRWKASR